MKKKALRKEFYMEVRKTLNRFLSILFITALGVAFFSGIRATQPDMELSADTYYDEGRLMDISVQGALGMTEEDAQLALSVALVAMYGLEGRWLARPDEIDYEAEWARFEDVLFPLPLWEGYR